MLIDTQTLIWLFPVVFMFHDFEEIILFEPWLQRHRGEVITRIAKLAPGFVVRRMEAITHKTTAQFAFSVSLFFALTVLASFLAAVWEQYGFFLAASGLFFLHGFLHLAQALALRRYVPAVITSALVVIPYGLALFARLLGEGIVDLRGLLIVCLIGTVVVIPLILMMHAAGEALHRAAVRLLRV